MQIVEQGVQNLKNKLEFTTLFFQFMSIGEDVDNSINQVAETYFFKLSRQNYHKSGSLLLMIGEKMKFA